MACREHLDSISHASAFGELGTKIPMDSVGAETAQHPQDLPVLGSSHASSASFVGQRSVVRAAYPRHMEMGMVLSTCSLLQAQSPVAKIYQASFETTRTVCFLPTPTSSLPDLLRAEETELEHAATEKKQSDRNHQARGYSVVLLLRNSPRDVTAILDAFAHIAAGSGDGKQAAAFSRFSVLCGRDAESYLTARSAALPGGRVPAALDTGAVFLAASCTISNGSRVELHTRTSELKGLGSSGQDKACEIIIEALTRFGASSGFPPTPAALLAPLQPCPDNAFLASAERAAAQFHELLVAPDTISFADFCSTPDYGGRLDFSDVYVRLIPKRPDGSPAAELDGPNAKFGLLVHASGKEKDLATWIDGIKRADAARPFGLPPVGTTSDEQSLALHVLFLDGAPLDVGRYLSTYGTGAVPGCRLSSEGCTVFQLRPTFAPLDANFSKQFFALPCSKAACKVTNPKAAYSCFKFLEDFVKRLAPRFDKTNATRDARSITRTPSFSPEPPETSDTGLGHGLDCPAARVGDVLASLQAMQAPPTEMVKSLLAASTKVSLDASIDSAWQTLREGVHKEEEVVVKIEKAPRQRAPPLPPPPAPPPTSEALTAVGFQRTLTGCSLKVGKGAAARDRGKLVVVLAKSLGKRKSDFSSLEDALKEQEIEDGDDVDTVRTKIARVATTLLTDGQETIFLAATSESHVTLTKIDGEGATPASVAEMMNVQDLKLCNYSSLTGQVSYFEKI
jgi:hypothetical protein